MITSDKYKFDFLGKYEKVSFNQNNICTITIISVIPMTERECLYDTQNARMNETAKQLQEGEKTHNPSILSSEDVLV